MSSKEKQGHRLLDKRQRLEEELKNAHSSIDEAIERKDRRSKIETFIQNVKSIMDKAVACNEELTKLSAKLENSEAFLTELEAWLNQVNTKNDECLARARTYLDNADPDPAEEPKVEKNLDNQSQGKSTT